MLPTRSELAEKTQAASATNRSTVQVRRVAIQKKLRTVTRAGCGLFWANFSGSQSTGFTKWLLSNREATELIDLLDAAMSVLQEIHRFLKNQSEQP